MAYENYLLILNPLVLMRRGFFMEKNNTYEITTELFKDYPDVVTTKECAAMLRICTKTVYELVNAGKLQKIQISRKLLITKRSVIDCVNSSMNIA